MGSIELGTQITRQLIAMANAIGDFAPLPGTNLAARARDMESQLLEIEARLYGEAICDAEYALAMAFRSYTAWYAKGDASIQYHRKAMLHLEAAVAAAPTMAPAKAELIQVLVNETLFRDLPRAVALADELEKGGKLPDWLKPSIQKARRWLGVSGQISGNDFTDITASPASLTEERTRLRGMLLAAIAAKNLTAAKLTALRLYNLSLLVVRLYGEHDCNRGVSGAKFDAALIEFRRIARKMGFGYSGRVEGAKFLSSNDYKRIERVLEVPPSIISIAQIRELVK